MDDLQSPTYYNFLGEWLGNFLQQMAALSVVWLAAFIFDISSLSATVAQIALVTGFVAFLITLWNWLMEGISDALDAYPPDMGPTGLSDDAAHAVYTNKPDKG